MNTRVALVEDDQAVRANLARLIGTAPGLACVAACASAEAALRELPEARPDVVLMDIHLPGASGIECVARLRQSLPGIQIIMLTVDEDAERVFESLKAGATGYLVKHVAPEEILGAIDELRRGGAPMSSHIARMVVTAFRTAPATEAMLPGLSTRESEVLQLLARGFRSKEIADELHIGAGTVNTHVRHIYEKLHVRSRAEAVARLGRMTERPGKA
ncbi:MAG: response regulator transcription factor [Verrucomicrobia bacterium]|nr:MAG: response regulator transcription factor [Verrucomicrobiota bacterium]